MSRHLDEIKSKLSYISANKTVLDLLLEFERTLDQCNVYAYRNWLNGELVDGPDIDRYWITCKFMYPQSMMPDPMGGMRLQKYGCKVTFEKDEFKAPVQVRSKSDHANPHTKSAKLKTHAVWVVTIQMPKRFVDERIMDSINLNNSIDVNTQDLSDAYDSDMAGVEDINSTGGL